MDGQENLSINIYTYLKKTDIPILTGYQIYHNYVRPHERLDDKTPADGSGIKIEGKNKWNILIQNARDKV